MHLAEVLTCLLVASLQCLVRVSSYPYYQTYIPNGDRVPNPCDPSAIWQGVGHQNPAGAGTRNPFGIHFDRNNHNWTAVCPLDSDNDGRTNGEELGDAGCTWQRGQQSPSVANLSHPGICEPVDSASCRSENSWLTCPPTFNCSAIQDPEVKNFSIRLPVTTVPTQQTTYMCYGMVLPNDTDYHVIAMTPIITNAVVDHHMLLYVCKEPPRNSSVFVNATVCDMDVWGCLSLMGLWSVGMNGQCLSNEYGFRIGPGGYQYVVVQVHLNNAYGGQNGGNSFVDSSGFTVFYTPRLRTHDGAVLMTGQVYLEIPSRQQSVKFSGGCSDLCTAALPGPINIAATTLHMHLLGQSGDITIIRKGGSVVVLMNETSYDYNSPKTLSYSPSIAFQPGDQFRVDCNYNSMTRSNTTYWGLSTTDEMCFGFITYYPANDNFIRCQKWRTVNAGCLAGFVDCDLTTFQAVSRILQYVCTGNTSCSAPCRRSLETIAETGCMSGDVELLFEMSDRTGMTQLWSLFHWCGVSLPSTTIATISHASHLSMSRWFYFLVVLLAFHCLMRASVISR